jgi:hypothetical protein
MPVMNGNYKPSIYTYVCMYKYIYIYMYIYISIHLYTLGQDAARKLREHGYPYLIVGITGKISTYIYLYIYACIYIIYVYVYI